MSPIPDPRFSSTRWEQTLQHDREAADRAARMDYIKPAVMLLVGGGGVIAVLAFTSGGGPVAALLYLVVLAVEVLFGVAGLWIACRLWLGGAGPLGLAFLRLAGIFAVTDLIGFALPPIYLLLWVVKICFCGIMLAWLFEFDIKESIMLAIITFLLKLFARLAVGALIASVT